MPHETHSNNRHHAGSLHQQEPPFRKARYKPIRSDAELFLAFYHHHETLARQVRELRKLVDELREEFDQVVESHQKSKEHSHRPARRTFDTLTSRILPKRD